MVTTPNYAAPRPAYKSIRDVLDWYKYDHLEQIKKSKWTARNPKRITDAERIISDLEYRLAAGETQVKTKDSDPGVFRVADEHWMSGITAQRIQPSTQRVKSSAQGEKSSAQGMSLFSNGVYSPTNGVHSFANGVHSPAQGMSLSASIMSGQQMSTRGVNKMLEVIAVSPSTGEVYVRDTETGDTSWKPGTPAQIESMSKKIQDAGDYGTVDFEPYQPPTTGAVPPATSPPTGGGITQGKGEYPSTLITVPKNERQRRGAFETPDGVGIIASFTDQAYYYDPVKKKNLYIQLEGDPEQVELGKAAAWKASGQLPPDATVAEKIEAGVRLDFNDLNKMTQEELTAFLEDKGSEHLLPTDVEGEWSYNFTQDRNVWELEGGEEEVGGTSPLAPGDVEYGKYVTQPDGAIGYYIQDELGNPIWRETVPAPQTDVTTKPLKFIRTFSEGGWDYALLEDADGNQVTEMLGRTDTPEVESALDKRLAELQEEHWAWERQQAEDKLDWEKEKYGTPTPISDYQQRLIDLDEKELAWKQEQHGTLSAWQEQQLALAREEIAAEQKQYEGISAWQQAQIDLEQQELEWRQEQHGSLSAWQEEQLALSREELALDQKNYLANLAAEPRSWLEYSMAAGETPVIQPHMLPLMPQEYAHLRAGDPIPGWQGTPQTGGGGTPGYGGGGTVPPAGTQPPGTQPPAGGAQPPAGGALPPAGTTPSPYGRPVPPQDFGTPQPQQYGPWSPFGGDYQGARPTGQETYNVGGRTLPVNERSRSFSGETYEQWLARLGKTDSFYNRSWYQQDSYSRGFMGDEASGYEQMMGKGSAITAREQGQPQVPASTGGYASSTSYSAPPANYPSTPSGYNAPSPIPTTISGGGLGAWQTGQPTPGLPSPEQMPELTRPSRQYQARMGPTAMEQYAGYEQFTSGIRPEELDFRLWSQAPPGGRHRGLTYQR